MDLITTTKQARKSLWMQASNENLGNAQTRAMFLDYARHASGLLRRLGADGNERKSK